MDSEDEEGFAKQGGDALEIGDEFDSEEEADEMPTNSNDAMRQPMQANIAASSKATGAPPKVADVKGK
jgi:hypothetical protein